LNEAEARSWLCAELPALRRSARDGGWPDALDDALVILDEGGSALDVLRVLDPDLLTPHSQGGARDGGDAFLLYGVKPTEVTGDYVCPDGWCPRRSGRDARGRPPMCELRDRPMRFTES